MRTDNSFLAILKQEGKEAVGRLQFTSGFHANISVFHNINSSNTMGTTKMDAKK